MSGTSRLAKVWRRTWIGGLMVAVLAGLFVLVDRTGSPLPILAVATALTGVAVFEVDRMGSLRGRGLGLTLAAPAATCLALTWLARDEVGGPDYTLTLAWALLAALFAHAGRGCLLHARADHPVGRACVLVGVALVLGFAHVAAAELGPVLVVALAAVAALTAYYASPRWAPNRPKRGVEVLLVAGLAVWITTPLFALVGLSTTLGTGGLLALVLLSKVGDIAGYYVGNAVGRRKIAPRISPGKTVEGCAGSLVAGVVAGALCTAGGLLGGGDAGPWVGAVLGGVTNLFAQAGDLLESLLKRRTGVKDSATYFGPAGGVLDLVDSLLLTVPVAALVWPLLLG